MCILDLSKTLMYDFHYNYIKKRYNNEAKSLFTDTDSLCCEIETQYIYEELWQDRNLFDNSDYPKDSEFLLIKQTKKLSVNLKMKQLACLLWNLLDSAVK